MLVDIGPHRVKHGRIEDGATELMGHELADLIYVDPPWGNLNFWETLNVKQNAGAVKKPTSLDQFMEVLFALITRYTKNVAIVEYGKRWHDSIKAHADYAGLHDNSTAQAVYSSKRSPLDVHIFSKEPLTLPAGYLDSVTDTHGMQTVLTAAKPFAVTGGLVFDPCCGAGNSARMALAYGMRFRGVDLNLARLQKTMRVLGMRA